MNADPANWSQNPFTWTAEQVIVNARRIKLQWLTRQVRSVAAWRGLQTRVNQLAAVYRGARREEVDQSDPARRTRAEVSKAAVRDRRFLAFMHSGKYSRAPLVATFFKLLYLINGHKFIHFSQSFIKIRLLLPKLRYPQDRDRNEANDGIPPSVACLAHD